MNTVIKINHNSLELPVILFLNRDEPKVSELVLRFFLMQLDQKKSLNHLEQFATLLSRFYNFYFVSYKASKTPRQLMMDRFMQSLTDPNSTAYKPLRKNKLMHSVSMMKEFGAWVIKNLDLITSPEEINFAHVIIESYQFCETNKIGRMFQIASSRGEGGSPDETRILRIFPTDKLFQLLRESSLREKLVYSFLAFGGRRPSELLHLYNQDINVNNNQLSLTMAHPSLAPIKYQGKTVARQNYLKEKFDLRPRNETGGSQYAGFKGLKWENQKLMRSDAYFIYNMDNHLVPLHEEYLKQRPKGNHPYYFRNRSGEPMTKATMDREFARMCKKLSIEQDMGVSMIGLKHFYGSYCSQVLQLSHLEIKRLLSQISLNASRAYLNSKEDVSRELDRINL